MEDYAQQPADNELTPKSKKRSQEFLIGWLRRKHLPLEFEAKPDGTEESEDKKESKAFSLLSKVNEKIRGGARRWLGIEIEPIVAGKEPDKSANKEEQAESSTKTAETASFESKQPEMPDYELTDNTSVEDLNYRAEELEPEISADEQGLLPVSSDARRRYKTEDLTEYINHDAADRPSEIRLPYVPMPTSPERPTVIEKTRIVNESIDHPILPTNELALSAGEILRRQHEKRLRRQVKELEKEAVSTKKEQEVVKKQQEQFQTALEEQSRRSRTAAEVSVLRHEGITQPQAETSQPASTQKTIEYMPTPIGKEAILPPLPPLPELRREERKEITPKLPLPKPEMVSQKIENAAEPKALVESLYERRHEVKDEPGMAATGQAVGSSTSLPAVSKLRKNGFYQPPPTMMPVNKPLPAGQPTAQPTPPQNMYKQAVLSGFWTAIAICILLVILMTIH